MNALWPQVARRMVQGLGVQPGELIQVRDHAGRFEVLLELLLAIEQAGATPLPEITTAEYLERLWNEAPTGYLAAWDRHRQVWLRSTDRVLTLIGSPSKADPARPEAVQTWQRAIERLTLVQEERHLPTLVVAIPTEPRARQTGLTLEALEEQLLPALNASAEELQAEIDRVLAAAQGAQILTLRTGDGCELHLEHGDRPWLPDDGSIDAEDRARGAIVSNLPAGSIYTTVLEDRTKGRLWLPEAGPAREVVLTFAGGRVVQIEAVEGAEALSAWLDSHSGEPRRVSHIGIALNPYLPQPMGWTLVDEHVHGNLFICLGENRYMGGQNESSLNVDYTIPGAGMAVDGRKLVVEGRIVV